MEVGYWSVTMQGWIHATVLSLNREDGTVDLNVKKHVDVSKKLGRPPAVMALHLKRFVPDWERRRINKRSERIKFPQVLDMWGHLSEDQQ